MDMTPQEIAGTTFRVVKKGFDPEEVRLFQLDAARSLEAAQSQAALMEQRARAAVAKAQGLAQTMSTPSASDPPTPAVTSSTVAMRADEAETISRTLLLAQHTADRTVAEASQQAATIRASAEADATMILDEARAAAGLLVAEARSDARRAGEAERGRINNEVQALLARLDFLRGDVQAMDEYAMAQRLKLLEVSDTLRALTDDSSLGLGEVKPPVLSTAADLPRDPAVETVVEAPAVVVAVAVVDDVAAAVALAAPTLGLYDEEQTPPAPIGRSDATPGVGSPLLPPVDMTFNELPTGEIPAIRPTSGPIVVPEIESDWDDETFAQPSGGDLRVIGDQ